MPDGFTDPGTAAAEAAVCQEADKMRGEIARLNERLARAEVKLSRLEITRDTVAEIPRRGRCGAAGTRRARRPGLTGEAVAKGSARTCGTGARRVAAVLSSC